MTTKELTLGAEVASSLLDVDSAADLGRYPIQVIFLFIFLSVFLLGLPNTVCGVTNKQNIDLYILQKIVSLI